LVYFIVESSINSTRRKENVIMKIDTSVALKAGLIGAGVGLVLALLVNVIPFLACVVCWVGPVVGLGTGALYVYFLGGAEIGEGALGGALSGAIGGLGGGVVNAIWSLIGGAAGAVGGGEGAGIAAVAGAGGFVGALVGGIIGGAVLGAIGGLVYSLIKKQ
jgi:hypothetical protein